MIKRRVEVVQHPGCVSLPTYATDGAAGLDVYAARPVHHPTPEERRPWYIARDWGVEVTFSDGGITLQPGDRARIPIGISIAVPAGMELQVRPRSGLAWRQGLTVGNSPGTIDSDYRGPVDVLVCNSGPHPIGINPGDRIAQIVLCPVHRAQLVPVSELPATSRGAGGFGPTGVNEAAGRPDAL